MRADKLRATLMIGGMVLSWSIYYAVSKILVDATGSALLAGFLLMMCLTMMQMTIAVEQYILTSLFMQKTLN